MSTQSVRVLLDSLNHILFHEINEHLSTELLRAELGLLVPSIHGDCSESHSLGILQGKGAEASSGTSDDDSVAGFSPGFLQCLVDGDTAAKDGCNGIKRDILGDARSVSSVDNSVLLEGTITSVAREHGLPAERFIRSHTWE
jgi:hypothetical protein